MQQGHRAQGALLQLRSSGNRTGHGLLDLRLTSASDRNRHQAINRPQPIDTGDGRAIKLHQPRKPPPPLRIILELIRARGTGRQRDPARGRCPCLRFSNGGDAATVAAHADDRLRRYRAYRLVGVPARRQYLFPHQGIAGIELNRRACCNPGHHARRWRRHPRTLRRRLHRHRSWC